MAGAEGGKSWEETEEKLSGRDGGMESTIARVIDLSVRLCRFIAETERAGGGVRGPAGWFCSLSRPCVEQG